MHQIQKEGSYDLSQMRFPKRKRCIGAGELKDKEAGSGAPLGIGRLFLIVCTCGLWLLVGRRKGTERTKYKNKKAALCQNCGHKWYVK